MLGDFGFRDISSASLYSFIYAFPFLAEYFHDASAGGGIFILGNEATSKIAVSDSDWDERTDYVIRVNGDSMMPDYIDL